MIEEENNFQKTIDLTSFGGKSKEKKFEEIVLTPGTPEIVKHLIVRSGGFIKKEKDAFYFILAIAGMMVIVFLFLLVSSIRGPYIPEDALINPERGLPISD